MGGDARHISYWLDTGPESAFPELRDRVQAEVCVVGAGITGILVATLLEEAGIDTVLLDADRVAAGVSGHTTGKVTSQHGLKYRAIGPARGRAYAQANEAGIDLIEDLCVRHAIDCDFERRPAFVYASGNGTALEAVRGEVKAAGAAGLAATFVAGDIGLPFTVAGAARFDGQAQFHVRRFLLPLASRLERVFEQTPVTAVSYGDVCRVDTPNGSVHARHVVLATHIPFPFRGAYFAKAFPYRSYVVAARLPVGSDVPGMYISADQPTRSIRTTPHEGGRVVMVGGEGHKVGTDSFTDQRYARLERWLRGAFPDSEPGWQWSTQDLRSADGVPFVGPLARGRERILIATAYGKWGMTNAAVAAIVLRDRILGAANPWTEVFESTRVGPLARDARTLVLENVNVVRHLADGHLGRHRRMAPSAAALAPGEGGIVDGDALYRDHDGVLHAVRANCTHMGCVVEWNAAETSWDCPCHGSRFDVDGAVLEGPATRPLGAARRAAQAA